jgi:two-component system response regulator
MDKRIVLLVEDNSEDEILTLRALEKSSIADEVVVTRDGVQAKAYLFGEGRYEGRDTREQPRLILLDLKMPRLDGLELLRMLRADPRTWLVPVVVLTSSSEEQDRFEGYVGGANSYVRKPVNFAHFVDLANQICLYWLMLNEPPPRRA